MKRTMSNNGMVQWNSKKWNINQAISKSYGCERLEIKANINAAYTQDLYMVQ